MRIPRGPTMKSLGSGVDEARDGGRGPGTRKGLTRDG